VHEILRAKESRPSLQQISAVRLLRSRSQSCRQSLARGLPFLVMGFRV